MTEASVYGPLFSKLHIPRDLRAFVKPESWESGYIHGPVGVGKSVKAACRLVGGALTDDMGLWVSVPELFRDLHGAASRSAAEDILEDVIGRRRLVLDDITAAVLMTKEWRTANLLLIVNYRKSRNMDTIFTGEASPEGLIDLFGESVASRIVAMGVPFAMVGATDLRLADERTTGYPENEPYLTDLAAPPEEPPVTKLQASRFGGRLEELRADIATVFGMHGYGDVWLELASDWPPEQQAAQQRAETVRRLKVVAEALRAGQGDIWALVGKPRPSWWWPDGSARQTVLAGNLGLLIEPCESFEANSVALARLSALVLEDERELIGADSKARQKARAERAAAFEAAAAGKKMRVR